MSKSMNNMNNMKERMNNVKMQQAEAKLNKIYNGTADLTELLNTKDIDMTKCERPITMMQLIYNAESLVGACTVRCTNEYAMIITEDTCEAYKKSLLMLKEREEHVPYESIWTEGINKFSNFNFKTGQKYVYYLVNNEQIEELARRIKAMDINSVTIEELQQLQNDLPPFIRAWQEQSIDVTKDKDKKFVLSYKDFFSGKMETKINTISDWTKKHADVIKFNLNTIREAKNSGENMDNKQFNITMPHETNDNVYRDTLGDINIAIRDAAVEFFNADIRDLFIGANFDAYEEFRDAYAISIELAFYIRKVFDMCNQSYAEDVKITKEQYATMRNAIYTKAAIYGVEAEEVVRIALSVCMNNIKLNDNNKLVAEPRNNKALKVNNVKALFPDEYVYAMTKQEETTELTIIDMNRDIADDETIEFENGYSIDGEITLEENFTGVAYECNGALVYSKDIYAYEETKALLTLETYVKGDNKNFKTDLGANFIEYTNEKEIKLLGNNSNAITVEGRIIAKTISAPELKGQNTIKEILGFDTNNKQQRIFLVVLN